MIEEDESDFETTNQHFPKHQSDKSQEFPSDSSKHNFSKDQEYAGNSLYSPLHHEGNGDLSETQYHGVDNPSNTSSYNAWSQNSHKKNYVRFSPLEESKTNTYNRPRWSHSNEEDVEKQYLSSGLNSQAELEILYAARGTEISQLTAELHQLHHQVALLGIFLDIAFCFNWQLIVFLFCRRRKNWNENHARDE